MLAKVVVGLRQAGDEALTTEFERLLWISHMTSAKDVAEERGSTDARRKLAIALLRYIRLILPTGPPMCMHLTPPCARAHSYIRVIPADKAFYDAGQCCRHAGDLSMAFVFLNRYLPSTFHQRSINHHQPSP